MVRWSSPFTSMNGLRSPVNPSLVTPEKMTDIVLDDIESLLRVLPNLLRLRIQSFSGYDEETDDMLPCISPTLRAFSWPGSEPYSPSFVTFLESHAELHEWHGRCFGTNSAVGDTNEALSTLVSSSVLERITLFETNLWSSALTILGRMTNLTHLSFTHRSVQHITKEIMRCELDAIRGCGESLVSLDLSDIPADWGEPVPWTVNQVLPLTPALQYLRVGHNYYRRGKNYNVRFTRTPKILESTSFTIPSTSLPKNLRLMVVDFPRRVRVKRAGPVGRDDPESAALRLTGLKDAETMSQLMPSLVEFVYYCHSFRRVRDDWVDISEDAVRRSDETWGAEIDW